LSSGITVNSLDMSADGFTITLNTTQLLTPGALYNVTLNGSRDRAGNTVPAGTKGSVTAAPYTPAAVGSATINGGITTVDGGVDVKGYGIDIGGTTDNFQFAYQERNGNFDISVCLADLDITDPYVKAGFMARQNLQGNSQF